MMIAGIETFTAVTAILSLALRSRSDLRCGALVLRYIGIDVIAATPFTFMLLEVLSQIVMKAGGPAGARCALPESSMSLTTAGPPSWTYSAASLRPIFAASCSTSLFSSMMISGRKPTPPAPFGIFTTSTSARAATGAQTIPPSSSAAATRFMSRFLADFDAGEPFERLDEFGDVGVRPHRGLADRHQLAHRIADDHRHAERLGLIEAELDVLVEQRRGEAEVEAARHHAARKLVRGRGVAARAGIDHVEHGGRIEAGLDTHHHRLGGDGDGGRRQKIVDDLHGLPEPGRLADVEELAQDFDDRPQLVGERARAGDHHRERALLGAGRPAAHRRIDRRNALFGKAFRHLLGDARAGGREVDEGLHRRAFDHAALAERDRLHDVGRRQADP